MKMQVNSLDLNSQNNLIIFKNEFVLFGGMAIVTYWVYELAILPTWMIAILVVVMVIWIANLSKGRRR